MMWRAVGRFAWVLLGVLCTGPAMAAGSTADADWPYDPKAPEGYFVWHPEVVTLLDRLDPDGDCTKSGPLAFPCLIQKMTSTPEAPVGKNANPFNLAVAAKIRETIKEDLAGFTDELRDKLKDPKAQQLSPAFLTHEGSRIELVGVINRMDRKVITDQAPGAEDHYRCGEVSVVYRFAYHLPTGWSRLPVTMNVIFPAIPRSEPAGGSTCAEVAQRWVKEMARPKDRSPEQVVEDLTDPEDGIISLIDGHEIERIELNIQVYRVPTPADDTDLGSTAEYVIRVFRWDDVQNQFTPSYLTNQVDRARILGDANGDANTCEYNRGVSPISKQEFLDYIFSPAVLSDIDNGSLNIKQEFLACRAVTMAPGGVHRSANNLFWDACRGRDKDSATCKDEQIFDDEQIANALHAARSPKRRFSFMSSPQDFRLRLSQLTCTGCHEARAIAGFHFPGADRKGTSPANSILVPGSPHFYGDQPRRISIIEALAAGENPSNYDMAPGYSSRPLDKFAAQLAHTELIGGWGAACLQKSEWENSKRHWGCKEGLECVALFESPNAPGLGTCMPPDTAKQIGDHLQTGTILSKSFGNDRYCRTTPEHTWECNPRDKRRDTRIEATLPQDAPADNSFYGGHQEYYHGIGTGPCIAAEDTEACFREKRDSRTGGFPAGMLRLSECTNLPHEATCGLIATNGFTQCLEETEASGGTKSIESCFAETTSYAGMRACDANHPCRDDYACLAPLDYSYFNAKEKFEARQEIVSYDPNDFGQKMPDDAWLMRNNKNGDKRGVCITSYFAFQFRSDKHPQPMSQPIAGAKGEVGEAKAKLDY